MSDSTVHNLYPTNFSTVEEGEILNSTVKFLSSKKFITVQSLEKLDSTVHNLYPTN